jgi:putative phosphoribosyl transferase
MNLFVDRHQAGKALAARLAKYRHDVDTIVLGLPRGGVPVAYEVARELDLPLDVFIVLKLGVPGQQELAMGALAAKGLCILNDEVVKNLGITKERIFEAARHEYPELVRREHAYRGDRAPVDVEKKTAILVDDGLATGASMLAAIRALRQGAPARIVAAVPVAAGDALEEVSQDADETVCEAAPENFDAVGMWYQDFSTVGDDEVQTLLAAAWRRRQ